MKPTSKLRSFLAIASSSLLAISYSHGQTILADTYLTTLDVSSPTTLYSSLNFPSYLDGALTGSSTLTTTGYFGSILNFVNNGASNTFSGNITVDSGTLRLAGSPFGTTAGGFTAPSMTSANTITINRAGTLLIDDTVTGGYTANRFGTAGSRPAVNLAGGTISLNGLNNATSSVQTLGALTSSSGAGTVNVTRNGNGNPTLAFSSLAISSGSLLTFNGTALGTGTNDARITFASAPTLTNGILAGARFYSGSAGTSEFVTYDTNGVRAFTAADYTDYATDINAATSTQNVRLTSTTIAPVALTGDVTVNSLNYNGIAGTWSLGGYKLTIVSGMFLRNGQNNSPTITNGTITAGTGSAIDLNFIIAQHTGPSISAVIADNGPNGFVTLVKSGDTRALNLTNNAADNTYTGGTSVVGGTLTTGTTANRRYLGTGKATVDGNSQLTLGNIGATSNSTGADYTAINGGRIQIASGTAGAYTVNDTFNIGAGSVISGGSASGQGLASLDRGIGGGTANITLAADAIIGHDYSLTTALNLTTGTIKNLGTNADLYYGINGTINQTHASAVINIGTGTAFKGLAMYNANGTFDSGTINVATGTTDVYIKTNGANTAAPLTMTLGYDFYAGAPTITLADAGTLNINVLGNLVFRDTAATFGDTSTGRNVRFVAKAGSSLAFYSAVTGMGSGTGIASALIENGGILTMNTSANALNGAVTVEAGGRFDAALAGGVTGSGQLTFNEGSIINNTHATGFSGSQATSASIAAGTIVRLGANNFGTTSTTLDSVLGSGSKHQSYLVVGNQALDPSVTPGAVYTLNKSAGGIGGVLTNDLTARTINALTNGKITLGANGGVIAATSGTTLTVAENIDGGALTIGTTAIIDGAPKLGAVSLTAVNTYTGGTTINAGTLTMGNAAALGSTSGSLTVNTGGTLNMAGNSLTVGNLTGTGGVISGTSGTRLLTIGQGDGTGGNYQGSIQNGTGGTTALTKTGTGTIALSSTNTYTGATLVSAGTLLVNGSLGNTAVTVNSGAFGGSGSIGSTLGLNAGSSFSVVDLLDALQVGGIVSIYAGFGVDDLAGLTWGSVLDGTYTLINGTLGTGVFDGLANNSSGTAYDLGGGRSAYFQEGSLQLVVTSVPEPNVAALIGALGVLALLRRRR